MLALSIWACQVAILGLFAAVVRQQGRSVTLWSALHFAVMGFRVALLPVLALCYSRTLHRKDFVPAAQTERLAGHAASYGTFGNDNGQVNQQQNGKKDSDKSDAKSEAQPGFKQFFQRIMILSPYLWPTKSVALQLVAVICFALLIAGRVVNLFVPLYLGKLVSALAAGRSPWTYLSVFVALKFLQGNGGILQSLQSVLWVPVSQYNDRSKGLEILSRCLFQN